MFFGSQERFALQSEVDQRTDQHLFGRVCLWAGNKRIGDYDQIVVLTTPMLFFQHFLEVSTQRINPTLSEMTSEEALDFVNEVLTGNGVYTLDEYAHILDDHAGIIVCPNGSESFDGELAILVDRDDRQKFIWRDYYTGNTYEVLLDIGECHSVLRRFMEWVDAQR